MVVHIVVCLMRQNKGKRVWEWCKLKIRYILRYLINRALNLYSENEGEKTKRRKMNALNCLQNTTTTK